MTVQKLLRGKGDFVPVIRSDVRIQDVIDQLEADDVTALVVSDDGENILGIISARDVVRGLKQFGGDVAEMRVGELMTRDVITCEVGQPMSWVLELMDRHQIRHVPITRDSNLCGIINMLDVVSYRLREIEAESEALKDYVAGRA